jgi:tRNA nucleotidyltransferase (CCA-adding enzyme)
MRGVPQPENYHPEGDVFVHSMLSLRQAANLGADVATRFAVLMHDIGKPICYAKKGNLRGHETVGLAPLEAFCLRWRIPNRVRELSLLVCEFHLHCHRVFELKPTTLFKWLTEQLSAVEQPQRFAQFLLACQSDVQGRGPLSERRPYPQAKYARFLAEKLAEFDKKYAAQVAIKKGLKGKEIGDSVKAEQYAFFNQLIKATENEKTAMQLQTSNQSD